MAVGIGDFQNDHLTGKEPKWSLTEPFRWWTATSGNEFRFLQSVKFSRNGRQPAFFTTKDNIKTFEDELFTNVDNGLNRYTGQFVALFVGPIRPIGVSLEQNEGSFDFLRCIFEFFDDGSNFWRSSLESWTIYFSVFMTIPPWVGVKLPKPCRNCHA